MYLALRPPWAGGGASAPSDAGVAVAPKDAGTGKPKKPGKPGRPRPGHVPAPGEGSDDPGPDTGPAMVTLTAADRALEWRGDAVALPPQNIDVGKNADARGLEQGEIESTTSSQAGGIRDCVVQAATNTDLTATITVQMLVDGSGHVTRSRVQAPKYMQDHGLPACAARAAARMKFPGVGLPTIVTLPVNLG